MHTPTAIVLALLTMQPRLEAEESILAANRIAVGGGKLKKESAEQLTREWSDKAAAIAAARSKPAGPPPGIKVRSVKREKKT